MDLGTRLQVMGGARRSSCRAALSATDVRRAYVANLDLHPAARQLLGESMFERRHNDLTKPRRPDRIGERTCHKSSQPRIQVLERFVEPKESDRGRSAQH